MWGNLDKSVQNTSGGFLDDSHAGASAGEKVKRGQNIVPVMIRHLTNCPGDLTLWGEPVRTVTFVGIIRHIEQATTKTTFEIEDETDTITAFRWLEAEKNATECHFELNTYVRVHGYLREQTGKKHVLVLRIWPLTDLNELTSHLLEVTYAMLKAEKMKASDNTKSYLATNSNNMDIDMTDDNLVGLTKEQAIVFKIIQEDNSTENGIERSVLKTRVPKNILSQVDSIIDFLASEGHIYSTLTDDHFKTT